MRTGNTSSQLIELGGLGQWAAMSVSTLSKFTDISILADEKLSTKNKSD